MIEIKHPEIEIELTGSDGNAFSVLGHVRSSMRRAGINSSEIQAFTTEATSGDYDHLLQTVMKWVSVS